MKRVQIHTFCVNAKAPSIGIFAGTLLLWLSGCLSGSSGSSGTSQFNAAFLTYPGVISATTTSTTCVTLVFPSANAYNTALTAVNVYASARNGAYVLRATIGSGLTSYNLCGLLSGTSYNFRVNAVAGGAEYPNFSTAAAQTTSLTSTNYNNVVLVQAFGNAPNAPNNAPLGGIGSVANPTIPVSAANKLTIYDNFIQPKTQLVVITWLPFSSALPSTQYALVRTGSGNVLDTTTQTACTSSLTTSCLVCSNQIGVGSKTCSDTNVASSPQVYDYTVVEYAAANWPEETPNTGDTSYRIKVPIPPTNMALVQRDSANYTICNEMGLVMQPLNHQRCTYNGTGAVPFASNPGNPALNLPSGYYDFGYDLFVDRWQMACNWTRGYVTSTANPDGTFTTPNSSGSSLNTINCSGTTGVLAGSANCYGNAVPSGGSFASGATYWDYNGGNCYYNKSGVWNPIGNSSGGSNYDGYAGLAVSSDPGAFGGQPVINFQNGTGGYTWAKDAAKICGQISDPNYGPKRIMRLREYIPASEFQVLPGDPNPTSSTVSNFEYGSQSFALSGSSSTGACNSATWSPYMASWNSSATAGFGSSKTSGYEYSASSSSSATLVIGSSGTRNCVSRFGIQDMIGNDSQELSDQVSCSSATNTCQGIPSSLDSANTDLSGFQFNGSQGIAWGPGSTTQITTLPTSQGVLNYNVPLGIPMIGNDNGGAIPIAGAAVFNLDNLNGSGNYQMGNYGGTGTYSIFTSNNGYRLDISILGEGNNYATGARCVVPAD
jgi:hypothetical protein